METLGEQVDDLFLHVRDGVDRKEKITNILLEPRQAHLMCNVKYSGNEVMQTKK